MPSRKGQFRRTMRKKFGASKSAKAERMVKTLKEKYPDDPGRAFSITTAQMQRSARKHRRG